MKHHYIPVFYLRSWCGPDERVCEYSRPYLNIVRPRRTHPSGTGYVEGLYSLPGYAGDEANMVESGFFSPIDSQAADAHRKMLSGSVDFTAAERSSWIRFVTSLLLRSPDDVRLLIEMMRTAFFATDIESENTYIENRRPDDPPNLAEFLRVNSTREYVDRGSMHILTQLIDNRGVGEHLINMLWYVMDVSAAGKLLLTSDRPVVITNGMANNDSFFMLPISPTKMFLAVNNDERAGVFFSANAKSLVMSVNRTVVSFASRFVWGRNDSALVFVQKEMTSRNAPTLMQMMARQRGFS